MRGDVLLFAVTEYCTVPLPIPDAPELMVTQEAELDATHTHPLDVVTLTLPVDADAVNDWFVGVSEYVHETFVLSIFTTKASCPPPPLVCNAPGVTGKLDECVYPAI